LVQNVQKRIKAPKVVSWLAVNGLSLVDNDEDSFRRWLNAPNPELEQKTPFEII